MTPTTVNTWAQYRHDPVVAARAAERMRDGGDVLGAAGLFTRISRSFPHLPYGGRELGVLRRRAGDADGAALCFERALALDPGDVVSLNHAVRHALSTGRPDDAATHLARFVATVPAERRRAERLRQLVDFVRTYPFTTALGWAESMRAHPRYLGTAAVERRVAVALAGGQPLSLIRLGDGEGAWLSDPDEEAGRFGDLYRSNRRRILRTWFGSDALLDRQDFLALRGPFLASIEAATIVGIPYPDRIRHEYGLASLDGVPGCTNVLRHVRPLADRPAGPAFCTHDVHLDLHHSGGFRRLIGSGAPIGVISCHPGLPGKIGRHFGARIARAILVPEEKGFAHILDPNGTTQTHFPTVFHRVVTQVRQGDWAGMLWLVAAGYLGKRYCTEIAGRGGVALDVGSLVDAWSGNATRPGLADLESYCL